MFAFSYRDYHIMVHQSPCYDVVFWDSRSPEKQYNYFTRDLLVQADLVQSLLVLTMRNEENVTVVQVHNVELDYNQTSSFTFDLQSVQALLQSEQNVSQFELVSTQIFTYREVLNIFSLVTVRMDQSYRQYLLYFKIEDDFKALNKSQVKQNHLR